MTGHLYNIYCKKNNHYTHASYAHRMKIIYVFSEPSHIMPSVIKSLPSVRFLKRSWQHIAPETAYQPLIQTTVCKKSSYLKLECFHECML